MCPPQLKDGFGRTINYMRLSLTDRCNLRCVYCMPYEGEQYIPHEEILSFEEFLRICRLTSQLGITQYKITGGEPFCRKGILDFLQDLTAISGINSVSITTNGLLLNQHLDALKNIGITHINISLDSIDQASCNQIARKEIPLHMIQETIKQAKDMGFSLKINAVPLKNYNQQNLAALAKFAVSVGVPIRFIELMPVGQGKQLDGVDFLHLKELIEAELGSLQPVSHKLGNGPASYYQTKQHGLIGFISALTHKFCHTCNRVRFTSYGYFKTCLHHQTGVELKPLLRGSASDADITRAIQKAVHEKPQAHQFESTTKKHKLPMHSIGG